MRLIFFKQFKSNLKTEKAVEKISVVSFAIRARNLLQFPLSFEKIDNKDESLYNTSTNYLVPLKWLRNEFRSHIDVEYNEDKKLLEISFHNNLFKTSKFEEV